MNNKWDISNFYPKIHVSRWSDSSFKLMLASRYKTLAKYLPIYCFLKVKAVKYKDQFNGGCRVGRLSSFVSRLQLRTPLRLSVTWPTSWAGSSRTSSAPTAGEPSTASLTARRSTDWRARRKTTSRRKERPPAEQRRRLKRRRRWRVWVRTAQTFNDLCTTTHHW